MAQTQSTVTDVWAILADNTSGNISPQDLRNAFETWRMRHGQIYQNNNAAATAIADTAVWYPVTLSGTSLTTSNFEMDSPTSGRLRYTGAQPVLFHMVTTISFTAVSNNQLLYFSIAKNGTRDDASEIHRKVGTGADVGALASHLIVTAVQNDYFELYVRNTTSASNITVETFNLQAISKPI